MKRNGEEQASVQAGDHPVGKQLGSKGPEGPGGHQADHDPAICPHGKQGQQACWPALGGVSRADPSPVLRPGETYLECWVQSWADQYKRQNRLEQVQKRATRMIKGREHLSHKARLKETGLLSLEKAHGGCYPYAHDLVK